MYECDTRGQGCQEMGYSCGTHPYNGPGCEGLSAVCGNCPPGQNCVNGQCRVPPPPPPPACQRNCNGRQCGADGCGGSCGNCAAGANCNNGQCQAPPPPPPPPPRWNCNPAVGYTVMMIAPGGSWEAQTSGRSAGYYREQMPDPGLSLRFNCDELPAAILLRNAATPAQVWLQDNSLPAFATYVPYNGAVAIINPGIQPTSITRQFPPGQSNSSMLIRISEGQAPVCQRNCNGRQCGADGCGGSCGNCANGANCANGQCQAPPPPPPPRWNCNPAVGYTVTMLAPGGSWEYQTSGPHAGYDRGQMPGQGWQLPFIFNCDELPAVILLRNAATPAQVWLQDNSLPPFAVYVPYNGAVTINPGIQPTSITRQFPPGPSNSSMLIRIPAN